jgi:TonB-linked SusC/RagA family outer membrane protein
MKKILLLSLSADDALVGKFVRFMKLTFFIVLLNCFQVSAHPETFTLTMDHVSMDKVLNKIQKESDYRFFYNERYLKHLNPVSVSVKGATLSQVLDQLLDGSLSYKIINDNLVVISPRKEIEQQHEVHGTVTDDRGLALIGVTVKVKGTNQGIVTDAKGAFTLVVPDDAVLEVSFIGYESKEIAVGDRNSISIVLKAGTNSLNQVVVTALGIERKKQSLGYSTQEVKGSELNEAPPTNFVNNLSGKVAGIHIVSGGALGSSAKITIRGSSSLSLQDNQPLFVIDGVPADNDGVSNPGNGSIFSDYGSSTSEINPADIQSVNVLKGPAAAALYGSRAANGAIIITTKGGASRKGIGVSYNTSFFIEEVGRLPRFQNKFGQGLNGEFVGSNFGASWSQYPDGIEDGIDESWGPRLDIGTKKKQFDSPTSTGLRGGDVANSNRGDVIATPWISHPDNIKNFFKQGQKYVNNVSFTGGNDQGNYRVSLSSMNQNGVIPNNNLDRYNVNLKSSYHLSDKITSSISFNYTKQKSTNRPENGYDRKTVMYIFTWLGRQVNMNSMKNYWQRGFEGLRQFQYNYGENHDNPFFLMYENTNGQDKDHLYGNVSFTYDITDHLKLELRTGEDYFNDYRPMKVAVSTIGQEDGAYEVDQLYYQERNTDFLLTYNNAVSNGDIGYNVSVGGNRFDQNGRNYTTSASQLIVPGVYNLGNTSSPINASEYQYEKRINSLYALGTVHYKDVFYLSLTGRNDWSSTLPPGNDSYFYPSIGLSSNLKALFNLPQYISKTQLRLSWAQVGNDADPFQIENTYGYGTPWGSYYSLVGSSVLKNADLKPEITATYEVGLALGFINDRLNVDFTYYNIRSKNQIINLPLVESSGETGKIINAGEIKNTGVEATLTAVPIDHPTGFRWNFTVNWSHNVGEVVSLTEGADKIVQAAPGEDASLQARAGERMGALWGPGYQKVSSGPMKGQKIIFSDGLPRATTSDVYLGNVNPDWIGSIYNQFTFKGVSLSFLFGGQYGGVFVSRFYNKAMGSGQLLGSELGRGARQPGHEYDDLYYIPGAAQMGDGKYQANSTSTDGTYSAGVYGTDARSFIKKDLDHISESQLFSTTYFKLRTISLGYSLPQKLLGKSFIKGARISVSARNLLLFTPNSNKDFDPEVAVATSGNGLIPGFENMSIPSTKGMGISIDLNF